MIIDRQKYRLFSNTGEEFFSIIGTLGMSACVFVLHGFKHFEFQVHPNLCGKADAKSMSPQPAEAGL